MRDGHYAVRFSIDGYVGDGDFTLHGNRCEGHDARYRLDGRLLERPAVLDAVFDVHRESHVEGNTAIPQHYALQLHGSRQDDAFSLLGLGPLGVIIEIGGAWSRPLDAPRPRA